MLLTKEERAKFAAYLELDAQSSTKLLEQMQKLHGMPAVVVDSRVRDIEACLRVAGMLRRIEDG